MRFSSVNCKLFYLRVSQPRRIVTVCYFCLRNTPTYLLFLGHPVYLMSLCVVRCPHSVDFDWQNQFGRYYNYYTYGAAVVQVEVDCLTGSYTVSSFSCHFMSFLFNFLSFFKFYNQIIVRNVYIMKSWKKQHKIHQCQQIKPMKIHTILSSKSTLK